MEESGSIMLEETVRARTDFFATDVDWVCISDNYFLYISTKCYISVPPIVVDLFLTIIRN